MQVVQARQVSEAGVRDLGMRKVYRSQAIEDRKSRERIVGGMGIVRIPSLIDISEAAINLLLSISLVFRWGIEGVAWGTFVPLVFVELFVFLPYACRQVGFRKRDLFTHSILPCLVPLAALWGYCEIISRQHYPPGWITLLCIAGGGGVVLLATGYPIVWLMQRARRDASPSFVSPQTSQI